MANTKKLKTNKEISKLNPALKIQKKLLDGLYGNDFSYYVYKMARLEIYYWLVKVQNQKNLDKVAHLIFNAKLDELFGRVNPDMSPGDFLYQIIFREIREGNDAAICSFEDSEYTDFQEYEGISTYTELSNLQKVEVWMAHVSAMTDHQPFPILANIA